MQASKAWRRTHGGESVEVRRGVSAGRPSDDYGPARVTLSLFDQTDDEHPVHRRFNVYMTPKEARELGSALVHYGEWAEGPPTERSAAPTEPAPEDTET
jgi:hypothetical protein